MTHEWNDTGTDVWWGRCEACDMDDVEFGCCKACGADQTEPPKPKIEKINGGMKINPQTYRNALAGHGPEAINWADKKHRLVYDLCSALEELQPAYAALVAERDALRDALEDIANDKDGPFTAPATPEQYRAFARAALSHQQREEG